MASRILVVDDEDKMRRLLEMALLAMGYDVGQAANGKEALQRYAESGWDLIISDMRMPELDGIELLRTLRDRNDDIPVIMLTAHGSIESAVEAMKLGATDYIIRPFEMSNVELAVTKALNLHHVRQENRYLREASASGWQEFIGQSAPMRALYDLVRQAAPTRSSVFISGATGTGKELIARAIHRESGRQGLFVPINCAAIPSDMLEAELFGYEKGAFTGAIKDRIGKFELANQGTLFLDELTEMPIGLQAKLLRILQENQLERLGSNRSISLDIRVVVATNRNPHTAVESGHLRQDLYYRLNVISIEAPPLAHRKEDIPDLAQHFIRKHALHHPLPVLEPEIIACLQAYNWPGNVRELENVIERALVLGQNGQLNSRHFPLNLDQRDSPAASPEVCSLASPPTGSLVAAVEALEADMIRHALEHAQGNKPRAAALLDISERTLWYKLKKYWPKDV